MLKSTSLVRKLELRNLLETLVIVGLFSSLVLPSLSFGSINVYLTTIISPFVLLLVLVFFNKDKPVFHKSALYVLSLSLMVVLSSFISWAAGLSNPTFRDINESIKFFQYIPYLLAISFVNQVRLRQKFEFYFKLSVFIFIFIGYIQFFSISTFNEFLLTLYLSSDSIHFERALQGYRITLTGTDPNVAGVIAYFFGSLVLVKYLIEKRIAWLFLFFLLLFLALQTQSRTSLIAFLFSLIIYFIFIYKINIFYRAIILVLMLFIAWVLFKLIDLEYVVTGINSAIVGENNSFIVRIENLQIAFERFLQFPILGWGPAKSEFSTVIDSEYALILQRYGIIGMILFTALLNFLFTISLKNINSFEGISLFMMTLMTVVIMFGNNVFSGYQLMSAIIVLLILNLPKGKLNDY